MICRSRALAGLVGVAGLGMAAGGCRDTGGATQPSGRVSGMNPAQPESGSAIQPSNLGPGGGQDTWRPADRDRPAEPYGSSLPARR